MAGTLSALALVVGIPAHGRGETVSLRLRGIALRDVLYVLHELTGQGYVVDGDVIGDVDVELARTAPEEIEQKLAALGLVFSPPGPIRRVSTRPMPPLARPGGGRPMTLHFRRGELLWVLELFEDVLQAKVLAPAGVLGPVVLFAKEQPAEDVLAAVLASCGYEQRREDGRIVVFPSSDASATVMPLKAGEPPDRKPDTPPGRMPHDAGPAPWNELSAGTLVGLVAAGDEWKAVVFHPVDTLMVVSSGTRYYDARVESIGPEGLVARSNDGKRIDLRLTPAAAGIVRRDLGPPKRPSAVASPR